MSSRLPQRPVVQRNRRLSPVSILIGGLVPTVPPSEPEPITASDSATLAEAISQIFLSVSDVVTFTDISTLISLDSITDSATLTESSLNISISSSDSIALSESVSVFETLDISATDTISFVDFNNQILIINDPDVSTLAESILIEASVSTIENVLESDINSGITFIVSDSILLNESAEVVSVNFVSASDSGTLSEANNEIGVLNNVDSIVLSDTNAGILLSNIFDSFIETEQILSISSLVNSSDAASLIGISPATTDFSINLNEDDGTFLYYNIDGTNPATSSDIPGMSSLSVNPNRSRSSLGTAFENTVANGFLRWDTSSLPDDATILSSTLDIYLDGVLSGGEGRKVVADWYNWGSTIDSSDWTGDITNNVLSSTPISSLLDSSWNSINLIDFTGINFAGTSYLRLGIDGTSVSTSNYIIIRAKETAGGTASAKLSVTHTQLGEGDQVVNILMSGVTDSGTEAEGTSSVVANYSTIDSIVETEQIGGITLFGTDSIIETDLTASESSSLSSTDDALLSEFSEVSQPGLTTPSSSDGATLAEFASIQVDLSTSDSILETDINDGITLSGSLDSGLVKVYGHEYNVSSLTVSVDQKYGSKFLSPVSGYIQKFEIYAKASVGTTPLRGFIYGSDGSNNPSTLLTASSEVVTDSTFKWISFTLESPIAVTKDSLYWIGAHWGGDASWRSASDVIAGSKSSLTDAYSDGPSDPFGTSANFNTWPMFRVHIQGASIEDTKFDLVSPQTLTYIDLSSSDVGFFSDTSAPSFNISSIDSFSLNDQNSELSLTESSDNFIGLDQSSELLNVLNSSDLFSLNEVNYLDTGGLGNLVIVDENIVLPLVESTTSPADEIIIIPNVSGEEFIVGLENFIFDEKSDAFQALFEILNDFSTLNEEVSLQSYHVGEDSGLESDLTLNITVNTTASDFFGSLNEIVEITGTDFSFITSIDSIVFVDSCSINALLSSSDSINTTDTKINPTFDVASFDTIIASDNADTPINTDDLILSTDIGTLSEISSISVNTVSQDSSSLTENVSTASFVKDQEEFIFIENSLISATLRRVDFPFFIEATSRIGINVSDQVLFDEFGSTIQFVPVFKTSDDNFQFYQVASIKRPQRPPIIIDLIPEIIEPLPTSGGTVTVDVPVSDVVILL